MDKIELTFTEERKTKRAVLFHEELGDQAWSDQDVAIGPLYIKKQALEMIGNPSKVKVTIEPLG
ncbi:unnamed protein product [marine sediment metagenome]|uniref:Uncharacterized protein n=1 Tax=marine sediment metagenome TaxID=412755 RepID=X1TST7_9ZZZZ